MLERNYQPKLIKRLRLMFPGCVILKNDSSYMQGVPDLTVFHNNRWGMLEVKQSAEADVQPNQVYYVQQLNQMSFAAFIYPDIEEEVLDALQRALEPRRAARVPKR